MPTVLIKKENGILGLTDNFAVLKEISKDGYYVYTVKYKVDPVKAVRNDAITVQIHVSRLPYNKKENQVFTRLDSQAILQNILSRAPQGKDLARSFQSNFILSQLSDISKRIPNDQTTKISNAASNQSISVRTTKELKLVSVDELKSQNIAMPIFQTNLFRKNELTTQNVSSVELRELAQNLIFNRGIDPAMAVGTKSNSIVSSKKVYDGVVAKQTNSELLVREKPLMESLLGTGLPAISTQFNLSSQDFIPVVVETPNIFIEIEEEIRIPIGSLIDEEFYLIFQLINNKQTEVETINSVVPHSKNVAAFQLPKIPPVVKFLPSGRIGKSILLIKQQDPNAVGVNIYRKIMNKHGPQFDSQYTFVGKLDAAFGEDFKRIEENHPNFNPTIFRIVPYNQSGILASEFTGIITKAGTTPPGIKIKHGKKPSFVTLSYEIEERGIDIEIKDIPPGPSNVSIVRRDLTLFEKNPTIVGDVILLNGRGGTSVTITDADVKRNHIYEYCCKLIYKDGDEDIASNKLVVEYLPVTSNIVDTKITNSVVTQNGIDVDVTFTLESSLIETNVDLVKRALIEQGLFGIFQEDIIQNKEKLQSLLGYKVVRTNLITGEIEDFGVIIDKLFSDRKFGKVKNIKPPQSGFEYKYSVATYFRSPETLLDTFHRTVQTSVNNSYELYPARWYHPVTLNEGNLVSARSLQSNHAKTDFTFGAIGDITTTNVSLVSFLPSIHDGVAKRVGSKLILVQWKVQGDINKIDHFIVILEMLGMKTIVGKSHNISDSNYFQFVDSLDEGEHGALTYYIVPVYYDYSRGTEIKTNQVIV